MDATDRTLTATMTEDFMDLWTEDVFEVFLWPDERHPVYFEYEISPLNKELAILVPNFGGQFLGWRPWHYEKERRIRKATTVAGGAKTSNAAIRGWRAEFFIPYALTSWNKVYGNVYPDTPEGPYLVFKGPYAQWIDDLLPNDTLDYDTLVSSGALPGGTPQQARDALMQPAFLAALQADPEHPVRQDARLNDLLGWNPKAPTLMCSGAGDPTVPMAVHLAVAMADFASRGLTNVVAVDVDPYVQATFAELPGYRARAYAIDVGGSCTERRATSALPQKKRSRSARW